MIYVICCFLFTEILTWNLVCPILLQISLRLKHSLFMKVWKKRSWCYWSKCYNNLLHWFMNLMFGCLSTIRATQYYLWQRNHYCSHMNMVFIRFGTCSIFVSKSCCNLLQIVYVFLWLMRNSEICVDPCLWNLRYWLCSVPQKKHYAKKRFPVTSNLWYMHGVLNVDEIKN
jgi:hypothetical protein